MEIIIDKLTLDAALENVTRAVESNPFLPIMKGVLIEAEDSQITFMGSDGEISIKYTIPTSIDAKIITPGVCLAELSLLKNVIKKIDKDIHLKVDGNLIKISSGNDKFSINLYNAADYPVIDFTIYGEKLTIDWNKLKDVAKDVWNIASPDDRNIILSCVNISAKNKILKMVATDRYRYAEKTIDIEENIDINISIIAKNLKSLLSYDLNGKVLFYISDHKIIFQIGSSIIQSKIVEQVYLDTSKIIPTQFANTLVIDKKEINNLLTKVSAITNENYNKIKLWIKDKDLTIFSTREEKAVAEVKTQNFKFSSSEVKIAMNIKYLKDAVAVFDDEITISITKDNLKMIAKSNSNPRCLQLFTAQKGF
ncbi:DNA polymerase III subunit beta [Metamycoplasma hyosynoviae]|uniref:DNA polymerase III subunit beta n=1 Tax=Metamycoplasma hyosynoviae TaxID=29559 RepID=A0A063YDE6_9BACT|nr:DNA polymerase III subunit beta [Metamycoplasma hyosynoviae]KDE44568.1 DNA polymerase III subunit beta [Metamycoplasma hyosynoviae]MDC8900318.1 DNA polymerase III subunit beta [Metamycoplasma hyosynoviae]MDC8911718.1 DNA polymerase III subunit beta [Metamycoplasma hyosynoviae]MDC8916468.1 DNA polymerase III subunit beta [Metamycoplasma hyosynoviae]MDC8917501.1 DNA polymerase III subunit beta [Metamycoplasma hyosynoviae]